MDVLPHNCSIAASQKIILSIEAGADYLSNLDAFENFLDHENVELPPGYVQLCCTSSDRVYVSVVTGDSSGSPEQAWRIFSRSKLSLATPWFYLRALAGKGMLFEEPKCPKLPGSFIDRDFGHDALSIGPVSEEVSSSLLHITTALKKSFIWLRLPDIISMSNSAITPVIFGAIKPNSLVQGLAGDCWLIATMACLAEYPDAIRHLFVSGDVDKGKYTVRLFDLTTCEWVNVTVDDYIPCTRTKTGAKPVFAGANENEMWAALLEKAFAKFVGSYAALSGGHEAFAFIAMTGFPQVYQFRRLSENGLWERGWSQWSSRSSPTCGFRPCQVTHLMQLFFSGWNNAQLRYVVRKAVEIQDEEFFIGRVDH